ncbi:hypothetical protein ACFL6N_07395 [Thermodesulfobacteriota bacterium]
MKTLNDLWDELGSLPEDEHMHVITKLFSIYEDLLNQDSGNQEAQSFFHHLDNAITQTSQCNLNRR